MPQTMDIHEYDLFMNLKHCLVFTNILVSEGCMILKTSLITCGGADRSMNR